ncbi:MAG: DUF2960 domain-containing protein [Tolumonas sp.]|jgi:hypothetical protein|uniref:DUF2960 domain-containing protein n=1 Tax=Tolumonas auensis (strain DSM 9187 / NBRC 110442 / TA 4) TaxID=595494 RepID=C4L9W8_TOLAT|nr:DUF2960 domain-containing protein [Tolumonas auensis]ACQ92097.1 conserved hypothetical protein [Tolumonas auensis DSM 9187]MBP7980358.1 DUF2960 domain-containing protein [Tolumonas sp.]NCB57986.1 DUF2960 domain-containing protein [Gammaproteobacteria bacterium]
MALKISYSYKGQPRLIQYANDKYHDIYEAIAAEEGVDLRAYLAMERQLASLTKKVGAVKDFRDNKFLEFGFNDIKVIKE